MTSWSRGTSPTSVVLPAPVEPTIAVVVPGSRAQRHLAQHRRLGARVGEGDAAQLDRDRAGRDDDRVGRAACTEDSVSSTSWMRPAETVARGIIIAMKVAIITDMRIWMR